LLAVASVSYRHIGVRCSDPSGQSVVCGAGKRFEVLLAVTSATRRSEGDRRCLATVALRLDSGDPAPLHTDDEVREWFASVLGSDPGLWVIAPGDRPVALLVLEGDWINHLYVDPPWRGQGLGSMLITLAKELHPQRLDLWTFQSNTAARRFYERHGFVAIDTTNGQNEEHAPDVHYRWSA
jgi:GNAT superfamily N-acetyltransferase